MGWNKRFLEGVADKSIELSALRDPFGAGYQVFAYANRSRGASQMVHLKTAHTGDNARAFIRGIRADARVLAVGSRTQRVKASRGKKSYLRKKAVRRK